MAGGRWAEAGCSTVGVPTKWGEMLDWYIMIGDREGLRAAPTHPMWLQEQGFPLILVHGRSIFKLKGVPWPSTILRCTIIERASNARSRMVHLDMVLGHGTPFNLKIDLPCTKNNGNPCSCGHVG